MPRILHPSLLCLLFSLGLFAQEKYTISGVVKDSLNNETLIGVNLIIPSLKTGTMTNEYGFYSITLPEGTYELQLSYLGFKSVTLRIDLTQD